MLVVGLTGGLATGKSTVLAIFREHGLAVIDADAVARKVLQPGTSAWQEVRKHFGEDCFNSDGTVNRIKLGDVVFNNVEKRRKLNSITHPAIQMEMMKMALKFFFKGHTYIVMEVPLLFESGKMLTFMYKIITVVCEDHQQLERLCKRNLLSLEDAKKRIGSQMPLAQKVAQSHFVIDNSSDFVSTRIQTENIIRMLKNSRIAWFARALVYTAIVSLIFGTIYTIRNKLL